MKNTFSAILKIALGLLFIFSGLIKANDPLGLSYKMDEFFEVLHVSFLQKMSLLFSLFIINAEILLGLFLVFNVYLKQTLRLTLLLTIFFTFLTAYAVFSGKIKSCGCFGDCIPLTANTSFGKDVILLVWVIFLLFQYQNKRTRPVFRGLPLCLFLLFATLVFEFFVLTNLPVKDCLMYKNGTNILSELNKKITNTEQKEIIYKYAKDNKIIEFSATNFPKDFDSTYVYIDRQDKIVNTGDGKAPMEFDLLDEHFENKNIAVLSQAQPVNLLFVKNNSILKNSSTQKIISAIQQKTIFENASFYLISSQPIDSSFILLRDVKKLLCDNVTLKTICRSNLTLYQLQNGIVKNKVGFLHLNYFY